MGGLPIWYWLFVIIVWVAWMVPLYKILGRIGWPQGWTFVALFPPLAMVLLWCIAFGTWTSVDNDNLRA